MLFVLLFLFLLWNILSFLKAKYVEPHDRREIHEASLVEDGLTGIQPPWSVLNFWGSLLAPRGSLKQLENKDVQNKLLGRICMFCLQCLLKKFIVINLCTPFSLITQIHTKFLSAVHHSPIPVWAHGVSSAWVPTLPSMNLCQSKFYSPQFQFPFLIPRLFQLSAIFLSSKYCSIPLF